MVFLCIACREKTKSGVKSSILGFLIKSAHWTTGRGVGKENGENLRPENQEICCQVSKQMAVHSMIEENHPEKNVASFWTFAC